MSKYLDPILCPLNVKFLPISIPLSNFPEKHSYKELTPISPPTWLQIRQKAATQVQNQPSHPRPSTQLVFSRLSMVSMNCHRRADLSHVYGYSILAFKPSNRWNRLHSAVSMIGTDALYRSGRSALQPLPSTRETMGAEKSMDMRMELGEMETRLMRRICSGISRNHYHRSQLTLRSVFHGTALDTSLLIDHLGSYILHSPDAPSLDQHLVLGFSLGGHAAWQVIFNEPRVTAAVIVAGCPDYMSELTLRSSECCCGFSCLIAAY